MTTSAEHPKLTVTERLLVGARSLLDAEGASALTARKVATASGRSTMCVYTAFGSVPKMVEAVYGEIAGEFLDAVGVEPARVPHRYLEWARANPKGYGLLFADSDAAEGQEQPSAGLIEAIAARSARGDIRRGRLMWSMLHGIVTMERITGEVADIDLDAAWACLIQADSAEDSAP